MIAVTSQLDPDGDSVCQLIESFGADPDGADSAGRWRHFPVQ
jgi:hypothetical protein